MQNDNLFFEHYYMAAKPRILVAPLDWGLGHATRCVPIIEEIMRQGGEPVVGSAGRALAYLKAEFPALDRVELPAYGIHYRSANMYRNIGAQIPKLLRAAWGEHRQLQRLIRSGSIGAVISDNRFGCFSRLAPCVFITHQVHLRIPPPPLQWFANRINHYFIRRHEECWIPDLPGSGSLAGALSSPLPELPCRHIGILSRLRPEAGPAQYDILVLLSGPEPQRSRLETLLIRQLKNLPCRVLLVQGKTEQDGRSRPAPNIEAVSYLTAGALQAAMASSSLVISRSGYSTIMDLAAMGKKALLIPTPGQTEQEYLARRVQQMGYCPFQGQEELNLKKGLPELESYPGFPEYPAGGAPLEAAVRNFLKVSS